MPKTRGDVRIDSDEIAAGRVYSTAVCVNAQVSYCLSAGGWMIVIRG